MAQALINLYIALVLLGGESMTGYAPRYDPGVMERVVARRHLPPAACNISSAYYGIGTELWVWSWNTKTLRLCRVADVSAGKDKARHQQTGRIIEASYTDADWMCGRQHLNHRPEQCPVTVIRVNE